MKPTLRLMAVALLLVAPVAFAQTFEESTLPVTEPLDVGGTILQPGTYLIRVLNNGSDRDRVVITNTDRTKVFATVLTVPHPLEPNEEIPSSTFVFFPAPEGSVKALRTWFAGNPPTLRGRDIVYEEGRARELARAASTDVVFYPPQSTIESETTTLAVVTPEAKIETYTYTPPATITTVTTTETTTPAPMISSRTEEVEMPSTASNLPLFALLGVLAIAGALTLRFARG